MPRVKIPNIPWRVSFYSFDLRERRHVHVFRERMECKVWIENGIEIAWNRGLPKPSATTSCARLKSHLKLINETYEQLLA